VLAFVALLAFALLGMAALTTDLGLASARQSHLETAADALALEAWREQARFEHGRTSCDEPRLEACVADAVAAMRENVLETRNDTDDAEVDLGPSPVSPPSVSRCGASCWAVCVEQAIPLLFGQGTLVSFQGASLRGLRDTRAGGTLLAGDGSPVSGALRTRGVPIGADVRAEARPALAVGRPDPDRAFPGRAPFALALGEWLPDFSARLDVEDDGTLTLAGREVGQLLGVVDGYRAGSRLDPAPGGAPLPSEELLAYVPLFASVSGARVVAGFGFARAAFEEGGSRLRVTRLPSQLALTNATASPRALCRREEEESGACAAELSPLPANADALLLTAPVLRRGSLCTESS